MTAASLLTLSPTLLSSAKGAAVGGARVGPGVKLSEAKEGGRTVALHSRKRSDPSVQDPTLASGPVIGTLVAPTDPAPGAGPVAGPLIAGPPVPRPPSNGFVVRWGTSLYLDGQPFRVGGLNIYNANSQNNCWYSMGSGPALYQYLSA